MRLVGGMILALGIALAALPAAAQDYNRGYSIEEYEKLAARSPGKGIEKNIRDYLYGLTAGLRAARVPYDKAGVVPLYCLPDNELSLFQVDHFAGDPVKSGAALKNRNLYDRIEEELATNGHAWRRDSTATVGTLALHVVRRKFPC